MSEKNQIVRSATFAGGGITDAERVAMDANAKFWIANAMQTGPVDREKLGDAIRRLYAAAGFAAPRVVIVPSPRIMAFAGGFAAGIWHLRKSSDATSAATRDATYAATSAATRDATDAATSAATYAATSDATYAATSDATYAATYAATSAATYAATLFASLARDLLGGNAVLGLECARNWWRMYQGGNMWSAWDAYLSAGRDILGLRLPVYEKFAAWEDCTKLGGFRLMHSEFCMVSEFPTRLCVDEQNRPHSSDGPSHQWSDGWSLWFIHGVRVTEQIVMRPETLTVAQIDAETNAEVRRIMIQRFGVVRYMREGNAELVHELPSNYFLKGLQGAKLFRKPRPNDSDIIVCQVRNSTPEPDGSIKPYFLRIDPRAYNGEAARHCHAAIASTFRDRDDEGKLTRMAYAKWQDYRPAQES